MAKFFFKKYKNRRATTHSQVVGIAWISAILLLFAGLVIFLPKKGDQRATEGNTWAADTTFLAQKEDSVYRQRRVSRNEARRHYPTPLQYRHNDSMTATPAARFDSVRPARRERLMVELNTADTLTLQLLRGIGSKRAQRIVEYRERLGGFHSVEQLLEVYSIDAELLASLAPHLTVDTCEIHKLDINTLTLKQLLRHPYIEYYQARDIVRLREKGVTIQSIDDLRSVPSMNETTIQRLRPYLSLQ